VGYAWSDIGRKLIGVDSEEAVFGPTRLGMARPTGAQQVLSWQSETGDVRSSGSQWWLVVAWGGY